MSKKNQKIHQAKERCPVEWLDHLLYCSESELRLSLMKTLPDALLREIWEADRYNGDKLKKRLEKIYKRKRR